MRFDRARFPAPVHRRMPAARRVVRLALCAVLVAAGLAGGSPVAAAEPLAVPELPDRTLRVGTKEAPPFAMRAADGSWSGLSIDLWSSLADELGLAYELEEVELGELFERLEEGSLDLAVAALTVTAEREERIDFSHPYYNSGLGIAVAPGGETRWLAALAGLASRGFLKAVGALVLVLLVTGLVVWLAERRRNPEQFGGGTLAGIGSGFWWSAVTMTTVGYGDKAPVTPAGRLFGLLWMFTSVIIISSFTAAIASGLTVARLGSPVEGPADLPAVRVGAPAASTSETYLRRNRVPLRLYDDAPAALAALAGGEVEAVVYDEALLRWIAGQGDTPVAVLPPVFERQSYAIALAPQSPLREALNRELLEQLAGERWRELLATYLGDE